MDEEHSGPPDRVLPWLQENVAQEDQEEVKRGVLSEKEKEEEEEKEEEAEGEEEKEEEAEGEEGEEENEQKGTRKEVQYCYSMLITYIIFIVMPLKLKKNLPTGINF